MELADGNSSTLYVEVDDENKDLEIRQSLCDMKQQSPGGLNVKVRIIRVGLEIFDATVGIQGDFLDLHQLKEEKLVKGANYI